MSGHSTEKWKEWILNVIDQLRKRKARPDLERICHFVERKYGLDRRETQTYVEKLVDLGVVIKVVYKRGTSYRNATKTRKRGYSNVLNSNLASRKVYEAVSSLIEEKRQSLPPISVKQSSDDEKEKEVDETPHQPEAIGVKYREIEEWIEEQIDLGEMEPLNFPLHIVVQREIDAGILTRNEKGLIIINSRPKPEKPKHDLGQQRPQLQKSASLIQTKRGRPPKIKHAVERSLSCNDVTSEHHLVAPVPVMPPHLCDFCQLSSTCNKKGQPEELLFCKDCNAKAHPSCMQYSPELASRARNTPWQCIDCKTCCICSDPDDADSMLFCDACDKGYHMDCHDPPVTEKPQGKWICSECVADGVDIADIENSAAVADSTVRSTDTESVESHNSSQRKYGSCSPPPAKRVCKEEIAYPQCASWTITEVVEFFKQRGFLEQATAFENQEIDGPSLLLMKRSDVLQGLSLKLGPALKIYNHVMKLQAAGHTSTVQ